MSIENPIGTTRKAVTKMADKLASIENIKIPTGDHFKRAIDLYRNVKEKDPKYFENMVVLASLSKDLKDKLGSDLIKVADEVMFEIEPFLSMSMKQLVTSLQHKNYTVEEIKSIMKEKYDEIMNKFTTDERIVNAFAGKENLLNEYVYFITEIVPKHDIFYKSI